MVDVWKGDKEALHEVENQIYKYRLLELIKIFRFKHINLLIINAIRKQ
jgi:hypothetical protein